MTVVDPLIVPLVRPREAPPERADFEAEALPHLAAVYNFSLGLTGSPQTAEDLTQETFLNAYRGFDGFEQGSNCRGWLLKICRNVFIDRYRRRARRPRLVPLDDSQPVSLDRSFDNRIFEECGFADEDAHALLFGDEVNRHLAKLPVPFRQALLLCDLEGLSYSAIAELMHTPVGTVRSRISRARNFLKDRLEPRDRHSGTIPRDSRKE